METSSPSCIVASPRECNRATTKDDATPDATAPASIAPKPASLRELRAQLRAQLPCNLGGTTRTRKAAELHESKAIPASIRLLIDRVMRVRDCPDEDREAFAADWRSDPEGTEQGLRHLVNYYGNPAAIAEPTTEEGKTP